MSKIREDRLSDVTEKFASMRPTEVTEKLASIGRAEKTFISTFLTAIVCASILFAMRVNVLTHDFPSMTLATFWQLIPIWAFFELTILTIVFIMNLVCLIEYLSVGFVFQRKVEIVSK